MILQKLLPIVLTFILGYSLKRFKILKQIDGPILLKLVFYTCLPAIIFKSIYNMDLNIEQLLLPFTSISIILSSGILAFIIGKKIIISKQKLGVLIIGSMIMNTGFVYPFVLSFYGEEGFSKLILFDFTNGILAYSLVYYLACKFGNNKTDKSILFKTFKNPPLWAMIIGISLNLLDIKIPLIVLNFVDLISLPTITLLLITLGLYFEFRISNIKLVLIGSLTRMFIGLFIAYILCLGLNISGINKAIILIAASAPAGYNTLVYSNLEKLDEEFAADFISTTIIIGMVLTPILIYLLN